MALDCPTWPPSRRRRRATPTGMRPRTAPRARSPPWPSRRPATGGPARRRKCRDLVAGQRPVHGVTADTDAPPQRSRHADGGERQRQNGRSATRAARAITTRRRSARQPSVLLPLTTRPVLTDCRQPYSELSPTDSRQTTSAPGSRVGDQWSRVSDAMLSPQPNTTLMMSPMRRSIGSSSSSEPRTSRLIQGRNDPGHTHSSVWCQSSAANGRSPARVTAAAVAGTSPAAPTKGQRPWVFSSTAVVERG
jgi:hypothetical protein